MRKRLKQQLFLGVVYLFTVIHHYIFFFCLRRLWARCFGISVGHGSSIHSGVRFFSVGKIEMGENSTVGPRCYLDNRRAITIGSSVNISHDTKIYTLGHDVNDPNFKCRGAPVVIENFACLFSNVIVMPGVKIGYGAVAYPGAVITRSVPPFSIVAGCPARTVGKRQPNLNYKIDYSYWWPL